MFTDITEVLSLLENKRNCFTPTVFSTQFSSVQGGVFTQENPNKLHTISHKLLWCILESYNVGLIDSDPDIDVITQVGLVELQKYLFTFQNSSMLGEAASNI